MSIFRSLIIISCGCFLSVGAAYSQATNGVVSYSKKVDYISVASKLPYMTEEEIDRNKLTWGNFDRKGEPFVLTIKGQKSVYTKAEQEEVQNYSWKENLYYIIRDFQSEKTNDVIEVLGKKFNIKSDIPKYRWKILNEIKEVSGYLCMKAETKDTVRNQTIHAWFCDAIPFSGGPEGYSGLPGLILELDKNNGDIIISATDVNLTEEVGSLPMPKMKRLKPKTLEDYNTYIKDFISKSIDAKRNPYWQIGY